VRVGKSTAAIKKNTNFLGEIRDSSDWNSWRRFGAGEAA
jgi:hypothetical protein